MGNTSAYELQPLCQGPFTKSRHKEQICRGGPSYRRLLKVSRAKHASNLQCFGDILLLEHLSSRFEKIKPGDVVMARSPSNPRLVVCKRVLGLEGDCVTVLPTSSRGHIRQAVVPKGHVWLQGDNAYNSTDSRHYGPVPYALIQGKVFYRIWPPEGWGPVLNQPP